MKRLARPSNLGAIVLNQAFGWGNILSIVSILISIGSMTLAIVVYRSARNTSLLVKRIEAINHVRLAMSNVVIHGRIDAETTANIREAFQLSRLVFGKGIFERLEKLHHIAFRIEHKPQDRHSDKDWDDKHLLGTELQKLLAMMQEAAKV